MADEKPTGDAGASISERLEEMLGGEQQQTEQTGQEAAPEAPETQGEQPAGDAPGEPEGPQYELSDVAKVLGLEEELLDVDEDGSLKIKTKIDGKEGAAKLQDLIKSYQLQGHVDAKVRQVSEQEKAHVERVTQVERYAQSFIHGLQQTATYAEQMLLHEAGQIDWDRMVQEDPIGYQAKRHEFEQRQAQVNQLKQAVLQKVGEYEQATQWKTAQELQREAQRLASMVPEWSDPKVRETEHAEMRQWLQSKGASEASINALRDAGLVAALRAGMLAERNAPKVAAAEKKIRLAPKLVKPGQGNTANDRMDDTVRALKKQIRDSGGKQGIAEYLIATGKV